MSNSILTISEFKEKLCSTCFENILELIGNTPLIKLTRITKGIKATVLAKAEFLNPGGSIKDRIGLAMIEAAEKSKLILPGGVLIEPTSGNTGIGLALASIVKGYKLICTIPDKMSLEKINLLKAYGAFVVITPTAVSPEDPRCYIQVARILRNRLSSLDRVPTRKEIKDIVNETQLLVKQDNIDGLTEFLDEDVESPYVFIPNQYFNPANPEIHYRTTGPEIWSQTRGKINVLVAGMGTGGTITGTGKYLKEQNSNIRVVGVDPEGSLYHHVFSKTEGEVHPYLVEGIGEDFMPSSLDLRYVDEIITVTDKDAFLTARRLVKEEGILAGGSSGAAVFAALQVARDLDEDKIVVVILPDTGRNYLNKIFSDEWMQQQGFLDEEHL